MSSTHTRRLPDGTYASPLVVECVRDKVAAGADPRTVAHELGYPVPLVCAWCGIKIKRRTYTPRSLLAQIGPMWRKGMKAREIAEVLDLDEWQVMSYAQYHRDECPYRRKQR